MFVIFWVGLVPASILLGDVFGALNPWRALGRTVAWISQTAAREPLPAPLAYPDRLGYLPAVAGLFAFTVLELVASNGDQPRNVASQRGSQRGWRRRGPATGQDETGRTSSAPPTTPSTTA